MRGRLDEERERSQIERRFFLLSYLPLINKQRNKRLITIDLHLTRARWEELSMDKQKKPLDEHAERIQDVKYVLERVIIRYERDLRHFPMASLVSLGFTLLGLFILWAVITDATVFVIGRTHFKLEPFSFGASSAFFIFCGSFLLVYSIYAKISYPSRLVRLKRKLKRLNGILAHSQGFEESDLQSLLPLEEGHKKLVGSLAVLGDSLTAYGSSLSAFLAGFLTVIVGIAEGFVFEAFIVGGILTLLGTVWTVRKYKKRQKKRRNYKGFTFDVEYGYQAR